MESGSCVLCGAKLPSLRGYHLKGSRGQLLRATCETCLIKSGFKSRTRAQLVRAATSSRSYDKKVFGTNEGSITAGDLLEMHRQQKGRCYYTGIEYTTNGNLDVRGKYRRNPIGFSLDRTDSSKPHTKDNVRLVCWFFNVAKSEWSLEEMKLLWAKLPK